MLELRCLSLLGLFSFGLADVSPTGDNTCQIFKNITTQVNTTYLQSVKEAYSEFCLTCPPTFKEIKYKTVLETRWKLEPVTRLVVMTECCDGYKMNDEKKCEAYCSEGCINGECTGPERCSCHPGYTGLRCQISGCDNGGWGPNCGNPCSCSNGGFCNPVHGGCTCPPGFQGAMCQNICQEGFYGSGCSKKCSCTIGHVCNHVTGDCIICPDGSFGEKCMKKCSCDSDGTELCNPIDGKCYCKENRFGLQCELLCPFGYINNTCFTSPVHNHSCQCPNHLYICDLAKGCVCPEGMNCGIQTNNELAELSPLAKSELDTTAGSGATVPVVIVLLLSLLVIILLAVYYRRRMKVLKTDLRNRSVRWFSDSPGPESARSQNEYVIEDAHPLAENIVESNLARNQTPNPSIIKNNNLQNSNLPVLNQQLNLSSQHYHGENPVYRQYHGEVQQSADLLPHSADRNQSINQSAVPGPSGVSSSSRYEGYCSEHQPVTADLKVVSEKNFKGADSGLTVRLNEKDSMKIGGLSVDLNGAPGSSKQNFVHSKLDALNAASCYEDNYEDDRPESPPPSYESLHVNIWTNKEQKSEEATTPSVTLTLKNDTRHEPSSRSLNFDSQKYEDDLRRTEDEFCTGNSQRNRDNDRINK